MHRAEYRRNVESGEGFKLNAERSRYRVVAAGPAGNWTRSRLRAGLAG